jgi:hypothetical protein
MAAASVGPQFLQTVSLDAAGKPVHRMSQVVNARIAALFLQFGFRSLGP